MARGSAGGALPAPSVARQVTAWSTGSRIRSSASVISSPPIGHLNIGGDAQCWELCPVTDVRWWPRWVS